jgi:methylated-DNA-[protein]-cysteine S-methyltransferase
MSLCCDVIETPVGPLYVLFRGGALLGVSINERPAGMKRSKAPAQIREELRAYFQGELKKFTLPFAFTGGTGFEQKVWLALSDIPYGETRSYKWLSGHIGHPKAARAVGQALSKNPLPIVLPCHRIIESDGSLGGFSPDISVKRRLLDLEYYYSSEA